MLSDYEVQYALYSIQIAGISICHVCQDNQLRYL